MTSPTSSWWQLHLRKARGESLTEAEERQYAAEIARHDSEEGAQLNLAELRKLRDEIVRLARENSDLRTRLAALETEIDVLERSLSQQTRELLGVGE